MLKHDQIIDATGGSFRRFQKIALLACMISYASEGYLVYNMVYLCLMPLYSCQDEYGSIYPCHNIDTCSSSVVHIEIEE